MQMHKSTIHRDIFDKSRFICCFFISSYF